MATKDEMLAQLAELQAGIAAEEAREAAERDAARVLARRDVAAAEAAHQATTATLAAARAALAALEPTPTPTPTPTPKARRPRAEGRVFTIERDGDGVRVTAEGREFTFGGEAFESPYATGREVAKAVWGEDAGWRGNSLAARLIRMREAAKA